MLVGLAAPSGGRAFVSGRPVPDPAIDDRRLDEPSDIRE
jgi:hypothetical protein